jgi:hypothetical protein
MVTLLVRRTLLLAIASGAIAGKLQAECEPFGSSAIRCELCGEISCCVSYYSNVPSSDPEPYFYYCYDL